MRTLLYGGAAAIVMLLAFWAYAQNYRTQAALRQTDALHHEISRLRERLSVLRAEWAYLNRPDRLRDLADLNFDRLSLFALSLEQFGRIDQIAFPLPPEQGVDAAVRAALAGDGTDLSSGTEVIR